MEINEVAEKVQIQTDVATSLQDRLASLGSSSSTFNWNPCIYTVPKFIQKENEDAFRPMVVSIGPVHYKGSTLETMQEVKLIYLKLFLQHPNNAHRDDLEHYINFVREREGEIRQCYEETILISSQISSEDDFIEMILLDAAFIIYKFLEFVCDEVEAPTNIPEKLSPLLSWVTRDLYLMENQLPFFILHDLYHSSFGSAFDNLSFTDIACLFMFGTYFFISRDSISDLINTNQSFRPISIKNLLHLNWMGCSHGLNLHGSKREDTTSDVSQISHLTLKELKAAGVKIVASNSKQVLDIKYENGVLKIPKIGFYDETESFLRNILYFEQCHSFKKTYIAAYVCFLDNLINTGEDVEILVNNGILIDNGLGSNEAVAAQINNLTKNIVIDDSKYCYSDVRRELKAYGRKPWNRWRAILRRQYFKHPWAVISVIAAIILFILTTLQTIAGFNK